MLYTVPVSSVVVQEVSKKALRVGWLFDGANMYIHARSMNIFVSSAFATSHGSCLVSWLYTNKLLLKYFYQRASK